MNELTVQNRQLPTTIEDLARFVLIGREKLTAVRAEIRAIDKLELATEVREQKKEEAQFLAGALLDAEIRMGELLKEIPKDNSFKGNQHVEVNSQQCEKTKPKQQVVKEMGLTKDQVSRFEALADNKDIVERVKAEAIENDDLPTRTEVLRRVKEKEREQKRQNIIANCKKNELPTGLFDVILADPPWRYEFTETENRAIENQYPTMDLEDIKNMKVPSADNSVLFLWATAPKLEEAMQVMSSWGFKYRTCAIWDKEVKGMGYWFRIQHELLLVGVKGEFKTPAPSDRFSSVIRERRSQHSKKPEIIYDMLEKMFPSGRYLELFARQKYNDNWEVWGNQV